MNPENWDPIVHDPIRMQVLIALVGADRLDFTYLKNATNTTDGNMATHLRKLEGAGYVAYKKTYQGRRPKTWYWITQDGRQALLRHLDRLEQLVAKGREKKGEVD